MPPRALESRVGCIQVGLSVDLTNKSGSLLFENIEINPLIQAACRRGTLSISPTQRPANSSRRVPSSIARATRVEMPTIESTLSATLERSRRRSAVQLPVARRHRLAQRQRCEPTLKLAAAAAAAAAKRGASQELLELELLSLRRLGCSLDRLG